MTDLNIYLNEESLHGQYTPDNIEEKIGDVISCLDVLALCPEGCMNKYYIPEALYRKPVYGDKTELQSFLNQHKDRKRQFQLRLKDFIHADITDLSKCEYKENFYDMTCLNVAYKSALIADTTLVNFPLSIFLTPSVDVKHGENTLAISSFDNSEGLRDYLVNNGLVGKLYDKSSNRPPRDDETILADPTVFEVTAHSYQGRKMYRRIGTDELWYVDNLHFGQDAHIEVFNENTKKQTAVCRVDKIDFYRDLTDSEKGRELRFDGNR